MSDPIAYAKPLPAPTEVTQPFWDGLCDGVLRIQRCAECSRHVFYPRTVCPHCLSDRLEWVTEIGRAHV